ncbi:MAG: 5-formyltetrahydrofolate cyclo-ligase [Xanthomonadaceae bacterium]|nr:5-formyltetrahydrofolate cyclo-ligase [Xanthomonadaceae bacterium]
MLARDRLRQEMKARRAALPPVERIRCAEAVGHYLLSQQAVQQAQRVAGYWAVAGELSLHAVASRVATSASYLLPRLGPEGTLRFARWTPKVDLIPNRYGIPEPGVDLADCLGPEQLDLVLIPLLAFDAHGNRVGMGGGWYDRSFAYRLQRTEKPFMVGVAYAFQEVDAIAAEPWDVPLDAVVTERGIVRTR